LAPPFTGGLHWSLLMAVCGPMLIAFTVALVFAPIQLEVLDLFPHERGAAASLGTFFGLMLNAVLAGVVAPLVSSSLRSLALTSAGFAVLGAAMWAWHLRAVGGRARRWATRGGGAPGAAAACRHRAAERSGCGPGRSHPRPGTVSGARQATIGLSIRQVPVPDPSTHRGSPMTTTAHNAPDRNLALELVRVTEAAAIAGGRWVGAGDKNRADGAAVDAMRSFMDTVRMDGTVVIGEGEKDEAPMLFNGESVGDGNGPDVDVAVDPIDGTRLTALGYNNALSVFAVAEKGSMYDPSAVFYMEKMVVGPEAAEFVDL